MKRFKNLLKKLFNSSERDLKPSTGTYGSPCIDFDLLLASCLAYCAFKGLSDLVDRINAALLPRKE